MTSEIDWATITTIISILVGIGALLKYVFYLLNGHKKHLEVKIDGLDKALNKVSNRLENLEDKIVMTREEMHKNFVSHAHLDDSLEDIKKSIDQIFSLINDMGANLNQLIGAYEGHVKDKK